MVTVLSDATKATLLLSLPPTGLADGFGLRSVPYRPPRGGTRRTDSPLGPMLVRADGTGGSPVPGLRCALGLCGSPENGGSRFAGFGVNSRHRPGWAAWLRVLGRNPSETPNDKRDRSKTLYQDFTFQGV